MSGVVSESVWWLEHYGFSCDPFDDKAPGFRFFGAQRKEVLTQLHHLAKYSHLVLVTVGPAGSGKTLLRQALAATTNKRPVDCIAISAEYCSEPDEIVAEIARNIGASVATVESIMARVGEVSLAGRQLYLLVDDAEYLDAPSLEVLCQLSGGGVQGRVHVFLFGRETLVQRLGDPKSEAELFHLVHLQPYELAETFAYLDHRLTSVGGAPSCLGEAKMRDIHDRSKGWPGEINVAARVELIEAATTEREELCLNHAKRYGLPWKYLLGACATVLAAASVFFFYNDAGGRSSTTQVSIPLSLATGSISVPPDAEVGGAAGALSVGLLPAEADQVVVTREPIAAGVESELSDEAGDASADVSTSDSSSVGSLGVPVTPSVPEGAVVALASPLPDSQPNISTADSASAVSGSRVHVLTPDTWYLSEPQENFVVQVLGTRSERTAKDIVKRSGDGFRYFTKLLDGKPLYVVTYGNFASRQAAAAAVAGLPEALRGGKPWVRRMSDVQQEIRKSL